MLVVAGHDKHGSSESVKVLKLLFQSNVVMFIISNTTLHVCNSQLAGRRLCKDSSIDFAILVSEVVLSPTK